MQKNAWIAIEAKLNHSIFRERMDLNRKYLKTLDEKRLLAGYFMEAGLNSNIHLESFPKFYGAAGGGFETPECQVKGSYAGHYMSACAYLYRFEGDEEMKSRGDKMVDWLEECQKESEDGWVCSIPSLYLDRIARDKWVWAPQYMVHKTLMGLIDMYRYANNKKALEIADKWSDWFVNWTDKFDEERLAKLADWESGGLMESWADLYAITGKEKYKVLAGRYYRRNLFDPLIAGEDILTFKHANTSIPEVHGCARTYEVTGEEKYRKAVEAFWHFAIDERDQWASGGQNNREMWVSDLTENISASTQEFCTVYNTIRLAEYLFRWTGEAKYAEVMELLLYNGVLAQQNKVTAQTCYFLPMAGGSKKRWMGNYDSFVCCNGTMAQAQTSYGDKLIYQKEGAICVPQYIPFCAEATIDGEAVKISMNYGNSNQRIYEIAVSTKSPLEFALFVRKPEWSETLGIAIDNQPLNLCPKDGWVEIRRVWSENTVVSISPEYKMIPVKLGEQDNRFAFRFGPILMAALSDGEHSLCGDAEKTAKSIDTSKLIFADLYGRDSAYIVNKRTNFKLVPLYRITDEAYQVYFPFIDFV